MRRHNWSSTSPKEPMLHLSLSPCTGYQLQLASSSRHWCLHIEQPQAQHPPTSTHYYESTSPPEVWDLLVSDASWYHHREAQNHSPEHSRSPFLAGGMIFPPPSGMLDPCQSSSNNWKLISFNSTWLHHKKPLLHRACLPNKTFQSCFYPEVWFSSRAFLGKPVWNSHFCYLFVKWSYKVEAFSIRIYARLLHLQVFWQWTYWCFWTYSTSANLSYFQMWWCNDHIVHAKA